MQLRLTLTTTLTLLTTLCLLTACGDSAPSVPDTPDGTVKAVADGLANNNPRVVWAAMPESWQKDVDGVVDSFADAVDTEIYDKSFALISKLGDVLKNKKSLILELAKDEQAGRQLPLDASKIETNYDAVVSMVNTIAKSDLAKKDSLKSMNIGKFLGSTGASIMKDAKYSPLAVANYFLERGVREEVAIDAMKLQKLIYLAHGWFLAIHEQGRREQVAGNEGEAQVDEGRSREDRRRHRDGEDFREGRRTVGRADGQGRRQVGAEGNR